MLFILYTLPEVFTLSFPTIAYIPQMPKNSFYISKHDNSIYTIITRNLKYLYFNFIINRLIFRNKSIKLLIY